VLKVVQERSQVSPSNPRSSTQAV